jgi:hypothetical protein
VAGTLTWNANGTLQQLGITDPFNSSNQQTCSYAYDDLARLASANCGSIWSQTFSFDPLSNLSKFGTISFNPGFTRSGPNGPMNQANIGTYDADGNLTTDTEHYYAYDPDGDLYQIDSMLFNYDALDRMVEQGSNGSYTQIVYGPGGGKLALMNGQTLGKGFVPLAEVVEERALVKENSVSSRTRPTPCGKCVSQG